jgi:hypothetical protein
MALAFFRCFCFLSGSAANSLVTFLSFLVPWRHGGSSSGRLHRRREGLQMCIASLLSCKFAI